MKQPSVNAQVTLILILISSLVVRKLDYRARDRRFEFRFRLLIVCAPSCDTCRYSRESKVAGRGGNNITRLRDVTMGTGIPRLIALS